jgi:kynurenine 3-monooxygenase
LGNNRPGHFVRHNQTIFIIESMNEAVTILGSGLVGSLLARLLAQRGHAVHVYERRPDPRTSGYMGGRSINLALSDRGWRALELAGVAAQVRELAIPMHGRMMHSEAGQLTFQPYGQAGQSIYSVSRGLLNLALMDAAEQAGASLHFGQPCREVDLKHNILTFQSADGQTTQVQPSLLFGADGAFSVLRQAMQRTDRFNYAQQYIDYGYKELTIPPKPDGTHQMEKHALHIWPRRNFMLIALPNPDGSFTCTLFFPFAGEPSFASLADRGAVEHFFQTYFADAIALMPDYVDEYLANPTSSLVTVRCEPWVGDRTALIGDAAHAIVPFYGQGMNCGFEDCRVLVEQLDLSGDWDTALAAYQHARLANANAIADLALQNFVEMRDLVADPKFLLRKKIEARLHNLFPAQWVPLYTMVTFSHLPYAEALRIGHLQDAVMQRVMQRPNIETAWEQLDFAAIVAELTP